MPDDVRMVEQRMGKKSPLGGPGRPIIFKMKAQLLDDGRSIVPLAETENMWSWIKVYASGGENTLHAHTKEDHMFVILSGEAIFFGPNGEEAKLGRNDGIMLPADTFYRFNACSEEPLVLLRVGSKAGDPEHPESRVGIDGGPLPGGSKKNKWKPPVYREGAYYE
ncbi:MAG: cupin [Rhodospirillaceae bacterium]|nr:cupin [Rhodospirillaceae bacterium]